MSIKYKLLGIPKNPEEFAEKVKRKCISNEVILFCFASTYLDPCFGDCFHTDYSLLIKSKEKPNIKISNKLEKDLWGLNLPWGPDVNKLEQAVDVLKKKLESFGLSVSLD